MRTTVSICSDIDFSSGAYADLFARSGFPCFGHPIWLDELRRVFSSSRGGTLTFVVARDDASGQLRFVLPLVRMRLLGLQLVHAADFGVSDYTDPIADPEDLLRLSGDPEFCREVARMIGPTSLLRLPRVRQEAGAVARLVGGTITPAPHSAHEIVLPQTAAEWRAGLSRATRKTLSRRRRQAEADGGLSFAVLPKSALPRAMDELLAFRAARFPAAGDALQAEDGFRFYRAVAERGVESGFVSLYELRHRGSVVALEYCLTSSGTTCSLLSGRSPDAEPSFSFGSTMLDLIVEDAIARGDRILDLAAGDEEYKTRLGTRPRPLSVVDAHAGPVGVVARAAAHSPALRSGVRRITHLARRSYGFAMQASTAC